VIATFGFLEGVAVGVIATVNLFMVSYSRTDIVKHSLSGSNFRSRVTRNPNQRNVLFEQCERILDGDVKVFNFSNLDQGLECCQDEILKSLDALGEDKCLYDYLKNI
jgi:MFS superfamily sulfate permease-like transporter